MIWFPKPYLCKQFAAHEAEVDIKVECNLTDTFCLPLLPLSLKGKEHLPHTDLRV